jgi:hypothetical protein
VTCMLPLSCAGLHRRSSLPRKHGQCQRSRSAVLVNLPALTLF